MSGSYGWLHKLTAAVANAGTVEVSTPGVNDVGCDIDDAEIAVDGRQILSGFTVTPGDDVVTVTNSTGATWPAGVDLYVYAPGLSVTGAGAAVAVDQLNENTFAIADLDARIVALEGAAPPGPEELAFADFVNGVYRIGGATVAVGDMFEEDMNWGPYDPTKIVAGVGMRCTGTAMTRTLFVLTDEAAAGLFPADGGFTCVLSYSNTVTGTNGYAQSNMSVLDLPGYNVEWTAVFKRTHSTQSNIVGSDTSVSPIGDAGDVHIAALTFSPTNIACSVDGNAVLADVTITDNTTATHIALQVEIGGSSFNGTAILESVTFYPPQPDADLPGLSVAPAAARLSKYKSSKRRK